MKKKTLRIDFIDESVDMEAFKHNDMADYIGAIRFPLAKLLEQSTFRGQVQIINHKEKVTGEAIIELKYIDIE